VAPLDSEGLSIHSTNLYQGIFDLFVPGGKDSYLRKSTDCSDGEGWWVDPRMGCSVPDYSHVVTLRSWYHQQPDVNYIQVLEKVDFSCTVHGQRVPFKGNQLRAETG